MRFLLERQQLAVDELLNLKLKGPTIFDVMPERTNVVVTSSINIKMRWIWRCHRRERLWLNRPFWTKYGKI
jgi:hypothetical protein